MAQLRSFVTVADAGSVRRAAAQLHVSAPSVSAAISALAAGVGAPLVERDGRGLRLTSAGRAFLPYARDVLGMLDQGRRTALEEAGVEQRRLRLAAVITAGEYILPALLRDFQHRRPNVLVSLDVGNRRAVLEKLLAREVDVAIGGRPPEGAPIHGTPFAPNEHAVVASPTHPLAGRRRVPLGELRAETWLVREPGSGTRALVEAYLHDHDLEPSLHSIGSNDALRAAAAVGLGIAVVPIVVARQALAAGTLARLDVDPAPPRRSWHALVLARDARPIAREFAAFLAEQAAAAL